MQPTPRNPDEARAGRPDRWHRVRRIGLVMLAVLLLHVIAVVWIARNRQVTWPPAPEQIIPTLLLRPEPVRPPAPPVAAAPKARPAPERPRPQSAPSPAPAPTPAVPDMADKDPAEFTGAGAQASGDTGIVTNLGEERPGPSAAPPGEGFSLPPSATLHYATYVNGVRNEDGVIRWATDGKSYTLSVEIPLPLFFGKLAFRSTGSVGAYGLAPGRYEEVRGRRQPDVTTFHYAADTAPPPNTASASTVTFTRTPAVLPLPEGAQDRFSIFLQLTGLARGSPQRISSPGLTLEIPIADTDGVEVARVQHIGEDTIDTPGGTIRAQHFIRLPRRVDDRRRVEIWLSPERGWLPVRLRQTEPNGMQFDLIYQSQEGG